CSPAAAATAAIPHRGIGGGGRGGRGRGGGGGGFGGGGGGVPPGAPPGGLGGLRGPSPPTCSAPPAVGRGAGVCVPRPCGSAVRDLGEGRLRLLPRERP